MSCLNLLLEGNLEQLQTMRTETELWLAGIGIDPSTAGKVLLAMEELFVNIISHGYSHSDSGSHRPVKIDLYQEQDGLHIQFTDEGTPFDPLSYEQADRPLTPDNPPIGGFGILLVRKLMDQVTYHREAGCNILHLIKSYSFPSERIN